MTLRLSATPTRQDIVSDWPEAAASILNAESFRPISAWKHRELELPFLPDDQTFLERCYIHEE